ncbi:TonB-dependent receptor [Methylocystis heyeri]|uniref:TonB-dependent receptor n=1 Tax=Methylocystis heyeri TaxID=391905 RepID=A0A6B8KAJ1_9HYPH|nr:TonB-dependent receptor [Methylocystis heyeri]QGM45106.1 TonB-dependent receptor [Methylocystis heyeri]
MHKTWIGGPSLAAMSLVVSAAAMLPTFDQAFAQADIGEVKVVARQAKPKAKPKPAPHVVHHAEPHPVVVAHSAPVRSHAPARVVSQRPTAPSPVVAAGAGAGLPISSDAAIGTNAPPGSAPALSPSQAPLNSFEPASVVSDKILRDVVVPSGDYNEAVKYTPGFYSNNPNGPLGDAKGGWRGFQDGQYNITFDGIPFGDLNDPTHHSAAYFPAQFLGKVTLDRGPGAASQVGYATFGGTLALQSLELKDHFGGSLESYYGNFSTLVSAATLQSGLDEATGVRALMQYYHAETAGALQYNSVETNQWLLKADRQFGDINITGFANYGREHYDGGNTPGVQQYFLGGPTYAALGPNPFTAQYVGYNNSEKQTDMEYITAKAEYFGIRFKDTAYTYAYWYPSLQNNPANTATEGLSYLIGGADTITSVKIPLLLGGSTKQGFNVPVGDITGYVKNNDYRVWGNIFDATRDIEAGYASGTLRTGVWWERGDNWRLQEYINYTTGVTYPYYATSLLGAYQGAYKIDLGSHTQNVQPFIEYEWRPIENLSITPGYKFEAFTRNQTARINQTTISPQYYENTYRAGMPFFAARYKITPEVTVYGQASRGFLAPTVSAYYVFNPGMDNIQPQTTTNYQLGAVYKSGDFTGDIDVYQITANNFPVTYTDTTGLTTYQNGGSARYRGIEAEGTYKIIQGLAFYASGAYGNARFLNGQFAGLEVGGAPRYTAATGFIYDNGDIFGSIMHKVTGDLYGTSGNEAYWWGNLGTIALTNPAVNHIPAYHTTDLVLGYRTDYFSQVGFHNKVEFKFGVTNLFDNHGLTDIGGSPVGYLNPSIGGNNKFTSGAPFTYTSQAGRYIYGGVKVSF